ncbi:hypothetical protein D3C80_1391440 [compost metagenome]
MGDGLLQQRRTDARAARAGVHHHVLQQRHPRTQCGRHRVEQIDHGDDARVRDGDEDFADRRIVDDRRQSALLRAAVRGEFGFLGEQLVEQCAECRDVGRGGEADLHGTSGRMGCLT